MAKTISEQIEELQSENIRLKNLEKLFDKMVKIELGMDLKTIRKILENHSSFKDDFIKKIADFYSLETKEDYQEFLLSEVRYHRLYRTDKERAEALFAQAAEDAREKYETLRKAAETK